MSDIVISVENVSKRYRLGLIGSRTLSADFERWWAKVRGKPNPLLKIGQEDYANRQGEYIWALRGVSFEVQQGEVLGIIGRNGAGKSTLLKILSRVTAPTSGQVKVKGRVASLLEACPERSRRVGSGFHPTPLCPPASRGKAGRENIYYLNGAIPSTTLRAGLGMKKAEIDRKFDEIVDFSGVEKFIDTPVKYYSSGMYVRLAFAVAAHPSTGSGRRLEPEILLVDESLP
jgi:lipopolysaccharide transport system ATP-binding protein